MTEQLKNKLSDSKTLRWSVLALVAFYYALRLFPHRCNVPFKAYARERASLG